MRLFDPKLILATLSIVLVAILVVLDLGQTSPGPLSTVHARAGDLDEGSCEVCHGGAGTTLAAACNACHTPIADQLAKSAGFHGALENGADCGHCHIEHLGSAHALVDGHAFGQAGFEPREGYVHGSLSFTLTGRHDELGCAECHPKADLHPLPRGDQRFLGQSQACASCHDDPHEGLMLAACEACHGQSEPFENLDGFEHTSAFPLSGVHEIQGCSSCHVTDSAHSVESLSGRAGLVARACQVCHESPHAESFIAAIAADRAIDAGASCETCHTLETPGFEHYDAEVATRLHGASGFELSPPHDQADCAACHDLEPGARHESPRIPTDCAACHATPHGEQFDHGVFAGDDCIACHEVERFSPSIFDARAHSRTGFLLAEAHAPADCADCHRVAGDQSLASVDFGDVARECAACHADPHGGSFVREGAADWPGNDCSACHNTTDFSDHAAEDFEHEAWTGFALEGAHAASNCESCHTRSVREDDLGRRFGRVAELFGRPAGACSTCHENVHEGVMAARSDDCAACHESTSFDDLDRSLFDHGGNTEFELEGAHARSSCETCHIPRREPDVRGRVLGSAIGVVGDGVRRCTACHEDVHAGRFDRNARLSSFSGREGCIRCHDQESFGGSPRESFEHELWTGFALDGAHAQTNCEDCHIIPKALALGRAPGTSCNSCHDDQHAGQFDGRGSSRCQDCHQSVTSFSELVFDHQEDSRFSLDELHAQLECSACHQSWPLANGGKTVRYKPLGVECADCHMGGAPR